VPPGEATIGVGVLRLQRQLNEMQSKSSDLKHNNVRHARERVGKANAEVGHSDRSWGVREPSTVAVYVAGARYLCQRDDEVTTGQSDPPNGKLMTMAPLDDQMLVEAKISLNVAFLHFIGQAVVKSTLLIVRFVACINGVGAISPDVTIQDESRVFTTIKVYIISVPTLAF